MPNIDPCRILDELYQGPIEDIPYRDKGLFEDDFRIGHSPTGAWVASSCLLLTPTPPSRIKDYKNTAFVDQEGFEIFINESQENRDPTIQADLLKSKDDQIQELIYRIKTSRLLPYRENMVNRILELYNDAKEEDPECVGIAVESLKSFNDFIHLHANLKSPTISLTPDYNIYASWRDDHNRVFSIHFLPNADVRFVMFKPNEIHLERKIRISGSATIDTLMEILAPHCLEEWISE